MNDKKLKKQLSPAHVWAIAFGCIIGWGSFINPGKKFLPNSGVAGTAIAMVLGAIVMIIIARSYAYMVPKYPIAGGEFTFTKNAAAYIAEKSFSEKYGARNMRRYIQKNVEDKLAELIISDYSRNYTSAKLYVENGELKTACM